MAPLNEFTSDYCIPTTLLGTEDAFVAKFSNLLPAQVEIKRSDTLVTVSWPAAAADFTLESNAVFGQGASWSPGPTSAAG